MGADKNRKEERKYRRQYRNVNTLRDRPKREKQTDKDTE